MGFTSCCNCECSSKTKAHLDKFWSEFFERSAKPRAAILIIVDVAMREASVRVIIFCSMQTLQTLNVFK